MSGMRPPFSITKFAGMRSPSTDFEAVRDDLQIPYLFDEVDLSTARSIAANTALTKSWKGNALYVDQNTDIGNATMIFHDPAVLSTKPGRIFVQAGFNAAVPFDQITIENTAQPGKVLRFFYGVDIDFKPGVTGSVAIGGTVNINDTGMLAGSSFTSLAVLAALTPLNVVAAVSNTAGVRVHDGRLTTLNASSSAQGSLLCKATAPATVVDGVILIAPDVVSLSGASFFATGKLTKPRRIAAGLRMDFMATIADSLGNIKHVDYDIM